MALIHGAEFREPSTQLYDYEKITVSHSNYEDPFEIIGTSDLYNCIENVLKQKIVLKENEMKPCPFCGMSINPDDPDLVYPSGTGWIDNEELGQGYRHYVSVHERHLPKEQWCYKVVCQTHYGGCGATASGDSKQEAIDNWNKRV